MTKALVLIDGEHYPPVVRFAIAELRREYDVVGAVFAGGTEKVDGGADAETYGLPVVRRSDVVTALADAIGIYGPEIVVDLSDEPVVTSADRFRLAGVALGLGVSYLGADFRFDPPRTSTVTATPTLAVVGTGKRVGKTAVSAYVARLFAGAGIRPVVLAMGRGGPDAPELLRGDELHLTTEDLIGFARQGRHASSDNYEDAVMSRVMTVGCRRCGGGLAGDTFFSNVPEGARLADTLGAAVMVLEGSGAAVPPVHADASLLVVGAAQGAGYVTDYFGPLRVDAADAVVIAGAEPTLVPRDSTAALAAAVRRRRPGIPVSTITFRPHPIEPVEGRRVFFATTAPRVLVPILAAHLEERYGCVVVASSPYLSDRVRLREDLDAASGSFDTFVTELKAAAIDVVAMTGETYGVPTVLVDNVPLLLGGDDLDTTALDLARLAARRAAERSDDE
jgi:cyclic 2,3-diphosphoglycerate synthetase